MLTFILPGHSGSKQMQQNVEYVTLCFLRHSRPFISFY